ncbi:hypothetical protein [Salinisphaera sp. S4-8]|uniref:hypothetical protein n=1 Tax=Salinisphaera sp. S4-8 TaxID=633357 RepID=UPI003342B50A
MSDRIQAPRSAAQNQFLRWLLAAFMGLTSAVLAAAEPAVVDTVRVDERRW